MYSLRRQEVLQAPRRTPHQERPCFDVFLRDLKYSRVLVPLKKREQGDNKGSIAVLKTFVPVTLKKMMVGLRSIARAQAPLGLPFQPCRHARSAARCQWPLIIDKAKPI